MGGYTVLRYAELHPNECELLMVFAPVVSGRILEGRRKEANPEQYRLWQNTGVNEEESKSRPGLIKRLKWNPHVTDSYKHDLIPEAAKITVPTLIVVGENDWPCPVFAQKKLVDALGSKERKLVVVPGAEHNFTKDKDLDVLAESFKSWIQKYSKNGKF